MDISKPFDYLEFHDSQLERIMLDIDGTAGLDFRFVNIYSAKRPDLFEVWTARATIRLEQVSYASVVGEISRKDELVYEAIGWDGNDREISFTRVRESLPLSRFSVETPYCKISLQCERAMLQSVELIDQEDDWVGPLRSGLS